MIEHAGVFLRHGRTDIDRSRVEQTRGFLSDAVLSEVVRMVDDGDEAGAAALL